MNDNNGGRQQHTLLLFRTAEVIFACEFQDIIKIEPAADLRLTPAPGFPDYMPGTTEIEGIVAPVIDTSVRFDLGEGINGERSCVILTSIDLEGAKDTSGFERFDRCAVLVDEVYSSETIEELMPPPMVNDDSYSRYLKGVFVIDGETVYVISPQKLIGE